MKNAYREFIPLNLYPKIELNLFKGILENQQNGQIKEYDSFLMFRENNYSVIINTIGKVMFYFNNSDMNENLMESFLKKITLKLKNDGYHLEYQV